MNEMMTRKEEFNPLNTIALFWGDILPGGREVTYEALKSIMDAGRDAVRIVDVREAWMYEKRHIPGSINIPVGELELLAPEMLDPDGLVVVVSQKVECAASAVAADKLSTLHYGNVLRYRGGYREWRLMGGPVEGAEAPEAVVCEPVERAEEMEAA